MEINNFELEYNFRKISNTKIENYILTRSVMFQCDVSEYIIGDLTTKRSKHSESAKLLGSLNQKRVNVMSLCDFFLFMSRKNVH